MKTRYLLLNLAFSLSILTSSHGRTWTSADETKTFQGELESYNVEKRLVSVRLKNGRTISFKQETLSEKDITFLKNHGKNLEQNNKKPSNGTARPLPEVLPDHDGKAADMSKPVQVFILMGQSNMVGFGKITGLKEATERGLYPYLVDDKGDWIVRNDVRNVYFSNSGLGPGKLKFNDWLSGGNGSGARKKKFGVEIGIGHHLGYALDAPVLILKVCIGNRSLGYDLLPPSAKGTGLSGASYEGNNGQPNNAPASKKWYAGIQYDGDTKCAKDALANLDKYYPGAKSYEVAGFFWWQGAADPNKGSVEHYETNLVHLINDLRKDFNAPNAKFVCATMGQDDKTAPIAKAQLAVDGEAGNYPQFKGNVATFYSKPVSKGGSANSHYGGNSETYMNVGQGMGRLMAELLAK